MLDGFNGKTPCNQMERTQLVSDNSGFEVWVIFSHLLEVSPDQKIQPITLPLWTWRNQPPGTSVRQVNASKFGLSFQPPPKGHWASKNGSAESTRGSLPPNLDRQHDLRVEASLATWSSQQAVLKPNGKLPPKAPPNHQPQTVSCWNKTKRVSLLVQQASWFMVPREGQHFLQVLHSVDIANPVAADARVGSSDGPKVSSRTWAGCALNPYNPFPKPAFFFGGGLFLEANRLRNTNSDSTAGIRLSWWLRPTSPARPVGLRRERPGRCWKLATQRWERGEEGKRERYICIFIYIYISNMYLYSYTCIHRLPPSRHPCRTGPSEAVDRIGVNWFLKKGLKGSLI